MEARKKIYLDSHATTRVDQEVLSEMMPYFTLHYGNGNHAAGWKIETSRESARLQVAQLIGARPSEIIFTSGSTEAINLGIQGLAKHSQHRNHIITQKTEHKAVLRCVKALEQAGFTVTYLDVDFVGRVSPEELRKQISADTLLVAVMLANNEIGTIQPVKEIGKICREFGAKFFCDLTQGLGWETVDVDELNIDLASISSHKIYGPMGAGALFARRKNEKVGLGTILYGGRQERNIRPGTHNAPAIVGFGKACEHLKKNGQTIYGHIRNLRDMLYQRLIEAIPGAKLNGCPMERHPGNLNISLPGVSGERLKSLMPHVTFSTTSACNSALSQPSHVLKAIQLTPEELDSAFRIGIGKYNTEEEITHVSDLIIDIYEKVIMEKLKVTTG